MEGLAILIINIFPRFHKISASIFPLCIPQVMKWKQTAFTLS